MHRGEAGSEPVTGSDDLDLQHGVEGDGLTPATAARLDAFNDLERVYRDEFDRLVGLARLILGQTEGAEELVQEAFVRTLARGRHLEEGRNPLPYVRTALVNLCRSRFRRRVLRFHRSEVVPSAEISAAEAQRRGDLLAAMAKLPLRQREVVALRHLEGLSTAETAEALSIAPGTVKAHLHRALSALRADLEDYRHE